MALIEIDGLPIKNAVIFHGYVSHTQMVCFSWDTMEESFPIIVGFGATGPWCQGSWGRLKSLSLLWSILIRQKSQPSQKSSHTAIRWSIQVLVSLLIVSIVHCLHTSSHFLRVLCHLCPLLVRSPCLLAKNPVKCSGFGPRPKP